MKIHVGIDLMLFCVCIMIHMYANMFSSSSWIVCVSCYMSFTNSFDLLLKLVRTYVIMKKNDLWNVIVKLKIKMFNISNKKLDEPINKLKCKSNSLMFTNSKSSKPHHHLKVWVMWMSFSYSINRIKHLWKHMEPYHS
jgi:hypothetical protein